MLKNFPFSGDKRRYVQLRLETYNTFSHHDYTGVNTGATFVSPTNPTLSILPSDIVPAGQPNGGRFGFGSLNAAASPCRPQIAVKIYY